MSKCTKTNCPLIGVRKDCDLPLCPWRTEEVMSDYIKREELLDYFVGISKNHDIGFGDVGRMVTVNIEHIIKKIEEAPSADVVERKRGEWISNHDGSWNCSECGLRVFIYAKGNYCPNCGARMKGADDE